jgi:hypothetical protein
LNKQLILNITLGPVDTTLNLRIPGSNEVIDNKSNVERLDKTDEKGQKNNNYKKDPNSNNKYQELQEDI